MTATADSQAQLLIRNDHFNAVFIFIENHFGHFSRLKRVYDEGCRIGRPRNDVDLLATQFANHSLNPRTTHTDAGTHGINRIVMAEHGNLCTRRRITRHGLDFNHTVVNFRHFGFKQFSHKAWMGARQKDLRAFWFAAHVIDIATDAVAHIQIFAGQSLITADHAFAAAQIDDHIAIFNALDDTIDDIGHAVFVFFKLLVALGFANALRDHLLTRQRHHAAKVEQGQVFFKDMADFHARVDALGNR